MAGEISKINGLKGGRPKAQHTIQAEKGKQMLIEAYMKNIRPINEALISKARDGDIQAIRELHDRVFGRANQAVDITSKGEQISTASPEAVRFAREYEEKIKKIL